MTLRADYTITITSFSITDEMPHEARASLSGRPFSFRPLWVKLAQHSTEDGWEAEVAGARVRRDGTDGTRTTIHFDAYSDGVPDYVLEAVALVPLPSMPGQAPEPKHNIKREERNGKYRWVCTCGMKSVGYPTIGRRDAAAVRHMTKNLESK